MIDFHAPADVVAPQLLGCLITHAGVTVRLTEVEAYLGAADEASHTFRGETKRNAAMFGKPGRLYVYISYGIHRAGNLVCAPEGIGQGCLMRAGEVVSGEELALVRRQAPRRAKADAGNSDIIDSLEAPPTIPHARLASGPGNLGRVLDLDIDHNGLALGSASFYLTPRESEPEWVAGPRIGISKNAAAPLRFWIPGDKTVTSPRGRPKRRT